MTDYICTQDFKNCPYRVCDLEKDYPLCDYFRLVTQLVINREFSQIPSLIRRACEWVQREEARLKYIREIAKRRGLDLLKNAQIGDIVFCYVGTYHEVKLIKKPSEGSIFVTCETPSGKIIRVQPCDLRRISKGNYFSEYYIEGIRNEKQAQEIEYKAKYNGFRAEIERKDNGYLLRIYGDSQQEVDDFISLFLEQDFDISPYI